MSEETGNIFQLPRDLGLRKKYIKLRSSFMLTVYFVLLLHMLTKLTLGGVITVGNPNQFGGVITAGDPNQSSLTMKLKIN